MEFTRVFSEPAVLLYEIVDQGTTANHSSFLPGCAFPCRYFEAMSSVQQILLLRFKVPHLILNYLCSPRKDSKRDLQSCLRVSQYVCRNLKMRHGHARPPYLDNLYVIYGGLSMFSEFYATVAP